jgi:hypothetical protein
MASAFEATFCKKIFIGQQLLTMRGGCVTF